MKHIITLVALAMLVLPGTAVAKPADNVAINDLVIVGDTVFVNLSVTLPNGGNTGSYDFGLYTTEDPQEFEPGYQAPAPALEGYVELRPDFTMTGWIVFEEVPAESTPDVLAYEWDWDTTIYIDLPEPSYKG